MQKHKAHPRDAEQAIYAGLQSSRGESRSKGWRGRERLDCAEPRTINKRLALFMQWGSTKHLYQRSTTGNIMYFKLKQYVLFASL